MKLYKVEVYHINGSNDIFYYKKKENAQKKFRVLKEDIKRYLDEFDTIEKDTDSIFRAIVNIGTEELIAFCKINKIDLDDLTED